jgi:hypothetical protein
VECFEEAGRVLAVGRRGPGEEGECRLAVDQRYPDREIGGPAQLVVLRGRAVAPSVLCVMMHAAAHRFCGQRTETGCPGQGLV